MSSDTTLPAVGDAIFRISPNETACRTHGCAASVIVPGGALESDPIVGTAGSL